MPKKKWFQFWKKKQTENEEDGNYTVEGHGHGPGGGKDYRKPKNTKGTLLRLWGYIYDNKFLLFAGIFAMIVTTVTALIATYLMKPLINDYIIPNIGVENPDFSGLARQLVLMSFIYLVGILATYFQNVLMILLSNRSITKLRKDLFDKLQDLPISYFDSHANGEIMSRFSNDADNVQMALEMAITSCIGSAISFVGTVGIMLYINAPLFVLTMFSLLVSFIIVRVIGKKSKLMYKRQQKALGVLNGYVEEMVEGIKVVKAFAYEKKAMESFNIMDDEYREAAIDANFYGMIIMPILNNWMNVSYALTAAIGGVFVVGGSLDIGSLATFLTYSKQVAMPINQLSNLIVTILSALAGAERMFNVIDQEPEVDNGTVTLVSAVRNDKGELEEVAGGHRSGKQYAWKRVDEKGKATLIELKGDVRLNHVNFSYVSDKPVLKDVNVFAKPGQKIAFVGSTGAGKTTITNLLTRFYDIDDGEILYDGININDIKKDDLRRSLVLILQDTHLFSGTVMDNIRYGRLDATNEECIEAAKTANAYNFIMKLPDGFQTELSGDGGSISQGQRQLLNIARAAVADPPVLIMDEATSSIDTRTEKMIETGMDKLMENCTVFVIAHRLSTVRSANAIAVIESGQIIEKGNHSELLALQGRYYQLYTGQHNLE